MNDNKKVEDLISEFLSRETAETDEEIEETQAEKVDEHLEHYGIPGMRWGVRRGRNVSARYKGRSKAKSKDDSEPKVKPKTSAKLSSVSDDDLRRMINRMQMEKQFDQLTAPERSAGAKFVSDVLTSAGKNVATQYATKYMSQAVEKYVEKGK